MNIERIRQLRAEAHKLPSLPDPQWPPSVYYRFLALLVKDMGAKRFVELGTCGGGASYNVAKMNPNAQVVSIDVTKYPQVADVEARCPNFRFVLGDSITLAKTVGAEAPVDVLFVDTIHTYEHTKNEHDAWLPRMAKGGVMCFDDLHREGLSRFWSELPHNKSEYDELHDLHLSGAPTDGGFGVVLL